MASIPYIPTPFPDEVLASLLTRFTLHNGDSVLRNISNSVAPINPNLSIYQVNPPHHATVDFITQAAGLSSIDVNEELTVIPFLRIFNKACTRPLDLEIIKWKSRGDRLRSSGFIPSQKNPAARFCSDCLDEDLQNYGTPYLHRSHQTLPALICTRHEKWLRTTCPSCSITIAPVNRMILQPLNIFCECGQDLRSSSYAKTPIEDSFKRLSQFCADSLLSQDLQFSQNQIISASREALTTSPHVFSSAYIEILAKTFGKASAITPHKITFSPEGTDYSLSLSLGLRQFKAEDFSTLFSAAGLTFEESKSLISNHSDREKTLKTNKPRYIYGLEQAKEALQEFYQKYPGEVATKFQRSHPRLYWLIRIQEPESLRQFCPNLKRLPSIEDDRGKLAQLFDAGSDLQKIFLSASRPLYRALIRDQDWLKKSQSIISANSPLKPITKYTPVGRILALKIPRKILGNQKQLQPAAFSTIERDLTFALMSALRMEKRPKKITRSRLSQISSRGVSAIFRATPPGSNLHTLIGKINADKDRRMALWAAQVLVFAGEHLTATKVLLTAGLNTTSLNRAYARSAIDLVARGLRRLAVKKTYRSDPEQFERLHNISTRELN